MPTLITFIGGAKITVNADLDRVSSAMMGTGPEQFEGLGARKQDSRVWINPANILYIEDASRAPRL